MYVWMNDFGSLDIDDKEHGHYASRIVFQGTKEECEQWLHSLTEEEYEKIKNS